MDSQELYEMLKKTQESQGYFFNQDREMVLDLLKSLLTNRKRYGYMSCPCRLASGEREKDEDIICPCVYRGPDLSEFGSCYCGLYVTEEWNDEKISRSIVPERRPPEKMVY